MPRTILKTCKIYWCLLGRNSSGMPGIHLHEKLEVGLIQLPQVEQSSCKQ
jgi:hypothetical protein